MAANEAHKRVETCLKNPIDARFIDHSAYMNDENDSWPNHTHITMCLTYDTVLNLAHLCARIGSPLTNWLVNGATISSIIESIGSTMMNSESIATITIEWNCSFDICCSNYEQRIGSSLKSIGFILLHMIWFENATMRTWLDTASIETTAMCWKFFDFQPRTHILLCLILNTLASTFNMIEYNGGTMTNIESIATITI
jgi:hypothetical protein